MRSRGVRAVSVEEDVGSWISMVPTYLCTPWFLHIPTFAMVQTDAFW